MREANPWISRPSRTALDTAGKSDVFRSKKLIEYDKIIQRNEGYFAIVLPGKNEKKVQLREPLA